MNLNKLIASIGRSLLSLLISTFLLVGIPLLGWGLDDLTGFLANPARAAFLIASGFLSIFYAWLMPPNTLSDGVKDKVVNRQKVMLWLSIVIYVIMFVLMPYSDRRNLWQIEAGNTLRYVGLAIFIIGLAFGSWGPLHLGKQFSFNLTIQEGHKLVTNGPFRWVRHPRYFGIINWSVGVSLIYLSVVGFIMTGIMLVLLGWRIYDEEKLLQQEFGQQWTNYCQRTKRLIPLIY